VRQTVPLPKATNDNMDLLLQHGYGSSSSAENSDHDIDADDDDGNNNNNNNSNSKMNPKNLTPMSQSFLSLSSSSSSSSSSSPPPPAVAAADAAVPTSTSISTSTSSNKMTIVRKKVLALQSILPSHIYSQLLTQTVTNKNNNNHTRSIRSEDDGEIGESDDEDEDEFETSHTTHPNDNHNNNDNNNNNTSNHHSSTLPVTQDPHMKSLLSALHRKTPSTTGTTTIDATIKAPIHSRSNNDKAAIDSTDATMKMNVSTTVIPANTTTSTTTVSDDPQWVHRTHTSSSRNDNNDHDDHHVTFSEKKEILGAAFLVNAETTTITTTRRKRNSSNTTTNINTNNDHTLKVTSVRYIHQNSSAKKSDASRFDNRNEHDRHDDDDDHDDHDHDAKRNVSSLLATADMSDGINTNRVVAVADGSHIKESIQDEQSGIAPIITTSSRLIPQKVQAAPIMVDSTIHMGSELPLYPIEMESENENQRGNDNASSLHGTYHQQNPGFTNYGATKPTTTATTTTTTIKSKKRHRQELENALRNGNVDAIADHAPHTINTTIVSISGADPTFYQPQLNHVIDHPNITSTNSTPTAMNVVPTSRYDPSTGQTIHVMTNKNGGAYRGGGDDDDFNNNYHDHASLGGIISKLPTGRGKNQINHLLANAVALERHRQQQQSFQTSSSTNAKSYRANAKQKYGW
jgi:hypothetical protein